MTPLLGCASVNGPYGGIRRCNLRWVWTVLVVGLVGGAVYFGWMYASWEPTVPEPNKRSTTIKIPAPGKTATLPESSVTTEISGGRFEVTLPIPASPALSASKKKETAPVTETTLPARTAGKTGPEGIEETDLEEARDLPPCRRETADAGQALAELEKPLKVGDLIIPPPQAIPPFGRDEKPIFILETERKGRIISVRGTTNLPVEGNGVQVNLFRVFREGKSEEVKRAALDTRNLPLRFEGEFPVRDEEWLSARRENERDYPGIFPALHFMDEEKIQVEILFTGAVKNLGPVPGLTVYPIPGTGKQVYRIVRSIDLPVPKRTREAPPVQKVEKKQVPAERPLRKPKGPTRIRISPLKWLDGPLEASLAPLREEYVLAKADRENPIGADMPLSEGGPGSVLFSPLVLTYRF